MNMFAKIKKMNIEELAEFLADRRCCHCAYFGNVCSGTLFDNKSSCQAGIKRYLSERVSGNA